jgi:hypothetical protein
MALWFFRPFLLGQSLLPISTCFLCNRLICRKPKLSQGPESFPVFRFTCLLPRHQVLHVLAFLDYLFLIPKCLYYTGFLVFS